MIRRRARPAFGGAARPAFAQEAPAKLAGVRIPRVGAEVGRHEAWVETVGEGLMVTSDLDRAARLAGFTLVRGCTLTRHRRHGGMLAALPATVRCEGRHRRLRGLLAETGLRADQPQAVIDLPRDTPLRAWWFPDRLRRPLCEPATGARIGRDIRHHSQASGGYRLGIAGRPSEAVGLHTVADCRIGFTSRGAAGAAVSAQPA